MPDAAEKHELRVSSDVERELLALESGSTAEASREPATAVADFLASHDEVQATLATIKDGLRPYLGEVELVCEVLPDELGQGNEQLFVGVRSVLPLLDADHRLGEFLGSEWDRLGPARERLIVGVE